MSEKGPKHEQMRSPKVALLKIPMDNTGHRGINDNMDDEHSVYVLQKLPVE